MKILLIRPSSGLGALAKIGNLIQPLGLLYLAAAVRDRHETAVLDLEVEPFDADRVLALAPDLVGVTMMTLHFARVRALIASLKRILPHAVIVLGGPHPSALPGRTLDELPEVDFVIVGEGEESFAKLADRLADGRDLVGIDGLYGRGGRGFGAERAIVADLDTIAEPARDLVDFPAYLARSQRPGLTAVRGVADIVTSRGCPFDCTFCAAHTVHGRAIRARSPVKVAAEIDGLIRRYGIGHVNIVDENFTALDRHLRPLLAILSERRLTFSGEARVDSLDPDLLAVMKQAGCAKLSIGVESGSERIRGLIHKKIDLDRARTIFAATKRLGIATMGFFMIGAHPEETREDIEQTFRLAVELAPDFVLFSIGTPLPGSELYRQMNDAGLIASEQWERFSHYNTEPVWRTKELSAEELRALHNRLHRRFYLRPAYIAGRLGSIRTFSEVAYYVRGFARAVQYFVIGGGK